ncbi:MAG: hypothetical protein OXF96_07310 [Chloroflexi bacterium]|nr:hypothetical protein [Chloroflexota bacterium]
MTVCNHLSSRSRRRRIRGAIRTAIDVRTWQLVLLSFLLVGCAANFARDGTVTETVNAPVEVELPDGITLPDPRVGAEPESCAERCAKCAAYGAACQETCELNCIRQHHPVCPDNCKP